MDTGILPRPSYLSQPRIALLWSSLFAWIFWLLWPTEYVSDDGGIVLRYLDNFAEGGFFQYNLESPPVFGISGFLHGLLAGGLSATRLVSPDASALIVNALGVLLSSFAILLILGRHTRSLSWLVVGWVFVISSSHYFIITAFQALEAPLHLGVVLMTYWAFLERRTRCFWFFAALSIISKLDATVVVLVLVVLQAARLLGARTNGSGWARELRSAILYGGILLGGWVLFTHMVFDGPLPQTAYAKVNFHAHPESRLAFLQPWWGRLWPFIVLQAVITGVVLALGIRGRDRERVLEGSAWLGGSLALVVLFSIYNPAERMPWYYVLPQSLLAMAMATSAMSIGRSLVRNGAPRRARLMLGILLVCALPSAWATLRASEGFLNSLRKTEPERIAVGEFVYEHAEPGDRLYTGHGHTARHARVFVHDYSGLNSPEVTSLRAEKKSPLAELRPEWLIRPGVLDLSGQRELGYRLRGSFYRRSLLGRTSWRVFHYEGDQADPDLAPLALPLIREEIGAVDRIERRPSEHLVLREVHRAEFRPRDGLAVREFLVAVARQSSPIVLELSWGGSPSQELTVPARDDADLVFGETHEIRLVAPEAFTKLKIQVVEREGLGNGVTLLEPCWLGSD